MARMTLEFDFAEDRAAVGDFLIRVGAGLVSIPEQIGGEQNPFTDDRVRRPTAEPVQPEAATDNPAPRRPGRPRSTGKAADPVDQYNKLAEAAGAAPVPTEQPEPAATDAADAQQIPEAATDAADELNPETALTPATDPEPAADPEAEKAALIAELGPKLRNLGVPWITHFMVNRFKAKKMSELDLDQLRQINADADAKAPIP